MELNLRQVEILDLLRRARKGSQAEKDELMGRFECISDISLISKLVDKLLDSFEPDVY